MVRARGWRATLVAAGLMLGLWVAPVQAAITVSSQLQGWVNSRGGSDEATPNNNTFTGNESYMRFNSWAMFFIPTGSYTSATLSLTPSAFGNAPPSTIALFEVSTPLSGFLNTFHPGEDVFADLGSGRQYAAVTLYDQPVSFQLNGRGLADINASASAGHYFLIGFTNQTLNALPLSNADDGIYISGVGRNMTPLQLELGQLAPVPEPASYAMLLGGLGLLALWRRRRALPAAAAAAACLLALAPAAQAQAENVTFDGIGNGFVNDGEYLEHAGYFFTGQYYGDPADGGGLVGAVLDGGDADWCKDGGMMCPSNNPTSYYAALNDGIVYMNPVQSGTSIKLTGFDASFIGGQQAVFPETAGVLQIQGRRADGTVFDEYFSLSNPEVGFEHFQTSAAFRQNDFVQLAFFGYACDWGRECNAFNSNQGQFGLDNLMLSAVPEPASYLLLGLGLPLLLAARRRAV
ncbi:MAG: NF038120 family PEP-CTERM protein [Sphingomonadaceae bacterium]